MAISGDLLSAVQAAIQVQFQSKLYRAINTRANFLKAIPKIVGEGQTITWDVDVANSGVGVANVGSMPEGWTYAASDSNVNTYQNMSLPWSEYGAFFELTTKQIDVVASSKEPAQFASGIGRYIEQRMDDSIRNLAKKINIDLFSSTLSRTSDIGAVASTPAIQGLISAWDGTAGHDTGAITSYASAATYAGVAHNAYDYMTGSAIFSATTQVLTFDLIDSLISSIELKSGDRPNLIIVSSDVARKYRTLFREPSYAGATYVSNTRIDMAQAGVMQAAPVLMFDGIPVLVDYTLNTASDPVSAGGKLFVLNTNQLNLVTLPSADQAEFDTILESMNLKAGSDEQEEEINLPVKVELLPKLGATHKFGISLTPQLQVTKPHSHGYIFNL